MAGPSNRVGSPPAPPNPVLSAGDNNIVSTTSVPSTTGQDAAFTLTLGSTINKVKVNAGNLPFLIAIHSKIRGCFEGTHGMEDVIGACEAFADHTGLVKLDEIKREQDNEFINGGTAKRKKLRIAWTGKQKYAVSKAYGRALDICCIWFAEMSTKAGMENGVALVASFTNE